MLLMVVDVHNLHRFIQIHHNENQDRVCGAVNTHMKINLSENRFLSQKHKILRCH